MIYKLIFCVALLAADVWLICSGHWAWAIVFFIVLLFAGNAAIDG